MRRVVILAEAADDLEAARDFYDVIRVGFGRNWPGAATKASGSPVWIALSQSSWAQALRRAP